MQERQSQPDETSLLSWKRSVLRWLILFAFVPYMAILTLFALFQRSLIYYPLQSAAIVSKGAEHVSLVTGDGRVLNGWRYESFAFPERPDDEAPPLLIYFPGNAGNRELRVDDLREFARLGFDVLFFDYRGYGDNPGSPNETAMKADARLVWQFAIDELKTPPVRIFLYGESLGGAVATNLAAELCEKSTPPAALITNATFASLTGTASWHYPYFPIRLLLWDTWPSMSKMPHVTCPVLLFHGTQDDIVPLSQGHKLFATVPDVSSTGIPKRFVELPHSGHNDIPVSTLKVEIELLMDAISEKPNQ